MYQLDRLKKIPGLVHGFSDIKDGNMSFDWGEANLVIENRNGSLSQLRINPKDCVITRTRMAHGKDIEIINSSLKGRGMNSPISNVADVDAMITSEKRLFLVILTADCLPVILYDAAKEVLALAHLSRINTPLNFMRDIVGKMKSEYDSEPKDIIVGIGPCIHKESYVFSAEELKKRIPDEKIFNGFVADLPDGGKAIDLIGYNVKELVSAGVPERNIEISKIDTGGNKNFFSHYRSGLTGEAQGRMATVVGMCG